MWPLNEHYASMLHTSYHDMHKPLAVSITSGMKRLISK